MKNRKSKWILGGICLFILIITIFVFIFRETILLKAGKFMAPVGDYKAEVAILEGTEFISTGAITSGMDLLSSGKVKRIVIVLQNIAPTGRPYGISGNYPDIVGQKLKNLGLSETEFKVIVVHIEHPVTLREAEQVLNALSKENIKSAILLSPGFHTRRSYLAYQHVGMPLHIKIFPSASFTNYQINNWWVQENGVRDFTAELLKLGYYLAGGYIPFKFSY
ncbi:MAG: hypothetical protein ABSF13_13990 [Smithella sp.]|jgi:hypothetical protein